MAAFSQTKQSHTWAYVFMVCSACWVYVGVSFLGHMWCGGELVLCSNLCLNSCVGLQTKGQVLLLICTPDRKQGGTGEKY